MTNKVTMILPHAVALIQTGKRGIDITPVNRFAIGCFENFNIIKIKLAISPNAFPIGAFGLFTNGADDRIRTGDLRLTKALRYHLCHISKFWSR